MKKSAIIVCKDERDMKRTLEALGLGSYHAVKDSGQNFNVVITGVPEAEYLVQAWDHNGRYQSYYCGTLEDAEKAAAECGKDCEFVEILKGYPGEWETFERREG